MLATSSAYVALMTASGYAPQSSIATTTFSIVGSIDGFPRESNGGWALHFIGNEPNPEGCNNLLNTTLQQGYSVNTYLSSNAVKAGDLVCVSVVLQNVNGTVVTWGQSDELRAGYNVTDSSGRVVDSIDCIPTVPPVGQGQGANVPRLFVECSSVWDTSVSNKAGVTPQPGSYHIIAFASYPGIGANETATAQSSSDFIILMP